MKKIMAAVIMTISANFAVAQVISESVRLAPEQVPVVIQQAFEKEIGSIPEGGNWFVRITRSKEEGKVVATPVSYTYTNRKSKDKIEVRFSPEGDITQAKGVTLVNRASESETGEGEKN